MEVTLIPGIAAVSGTLCKTKNARVIFTTRKASSTNPNKVRMYVVRQRATNEPHRLLKKKVAPEVSLLAVNPTCSNSSPPAPITPKPKHGR